MWRWEKRISQHLSLSLSPSPSLSLSLPLSLSLSRSRSLFEHFQRFHHLSSLSLFLFANHVFVVISFIDIIWSCIKKTLKLLILSAIWGLMKLCPLPHCVCANQHTHTHTHTHSLPHRSKQKQFHVITVFVTKHLRDGERARWSREVNDGKDYSLALSPLSSSIPSSSLFLLTIFNWQISVMRCFSPCGSSFLSCVDCQGLPPLQGEDRKSCDVCLHGVGVLPSAGNYSWSNREKQRGRGREGERESAHSVWMNSCLSQACEELHVGCERVWPIPLGWHLPHLWSGSIASDTIASNVSALLISLTSFSSFLSLSFSDCGWNDSIFEAFLHFLSSDFKFEIMWAWQSRCVNYTRERMGALILSISFSFPFPSLLTALLFTQQYHHHWMKSRWEMEMSSDVSDNWWMSQWGFSLLYFDPTPFHPFMCIPTIRHWHVHSLDIEDLCNGKTVEGRRGSLFYTSTSSVPLDHLKILFFQSDLYFQSYHFDSCFPSEHHV